MAAEAHIFHALTWNKIDRERGEGWEMTEWAGWKKGKEKERKKEWNSESTNERKMEEEEESTTEEKKASKKEKQRL